MEAPDYNKPTDLEKQTSPVSPNEIGEDFNTFVLKQAANLNEPGSKIWLPYLEVADKFDKELVEGWRDDMDALLIFSALFSAAVTAFVVDSYKALQEDTGNITINVLIHISQQLANGTQVAATRPQNFAPPTLSLTVNIFWFLSLAFSLICALAAIMVKQWARHYLQGPRNLPSTSDRAKMRQFLFTNILAWKMELIVEMIPALLHISLFLFFIGLLFFLHTISSPLLVYLICFSSVVGVLYVLLTISPLLFPGCPFGTPFARLPALIIPGTLRRSRSAWKTIRRFVRKSSDAFKRLNRISSDRSANQTRLATRLRAFIHRHRIAMVHGLTLHIEKRQLQMAKSQAHIHYRDALQWIMAFSTSETDLFAIVQALPEFIRTLADGENSEHSSTDVGKGLYDAQALLWQTGVHQRTLRLLSTCVERKAIKPSMHNVAHSCIAALHWLTRCPASFFGDDDASSPRLSLIKASQFTPEFIQLQIDFAVDRPDNTAVLWRSTLAVMVLDQLYQTEKVLRHYDPKRFPNGYHEARIILESADQTAGFLRSTTSMMTEDAWSNIWLLELLDAISELLPEQPPSETVGGMMELISSLQIFRGKWAVWILNHGMGPAFSQLSEPTRQQSLLLNHLYDAVTHIQHYPLSIKEGQLGVFRLLDDVSHWQGWLSESSGFVPKIPEALRSSYMGVLFGKASQEDIKSWNRGHVHSLFLRCVEVEGNRKNSSPFSKQTVHVHFNDYARVIGELVSMLERALGTNDVDEIGNVYAHLIDSLIRHRLSVLERPEVTDVPMSGKHLSDVRRLLNMLSERSRDETPTALLGLLTRTAERYGYIGIVTSADADIVLDDAPGETEDVRPSQSTAAFANPTWRTEQTLVS